MNSIDDSLVYFERTSNDPYDRHQYKLEFDDGKSVVFDDYEQLRLFWFEKGRNWNDCKVVVLDKKIKSKGGFK